MLTNFFLQNLNIFQTSILVRYGKSEKATQEKEKNGEGLTAHKLWNKTRSTISLEKKIDSPTTFSFFEWAEFVTDDYFYTIDSINEIYRKYSSLARQIKVL